MVVRGIEYCLDGADLSPFDAKQNSNGLGYVTAQGDDGIQNSQRLITRYHALTDFQPFKNGAHRYKIVDKAVGIIEVADGADITESPVAEVAPSQLEIPGGDGV